MNCDNWFSDATNDFLKFYIYNCPTVDLISEKLKMENIDHTVDGSWMNHVEASVTSWAVDYE